jgi:Enoyl-(Acyl carrier protein) reductase
MTIPFLLTNHVCQRGAVSYGCPERDSRIMRLRLCAFHALRFSAAYRWIVYFHFRSMHFNLTPMQPAEYSAAMLDEVNRKIPLGRHTTPEEIAGLFAYLASDDAAFATEHVFTIDGGETAGGLASR